MDTDGKVVIDELQKAKNAVYDRLTQRLQALVTNIITQMEKDVESGKADTKRVLYYHGRLQAAGEISAALKPILAAVAEEMGELKQATDEATQAAYDAADELLTKFTDGQPRQ